MLCYKKIKAVSNTTNETIQVATQGLFSPLFNFIHRILENVNIFLRKFLLFAILNLIVYTALRGSK